MLSKKRLLAICIILVLIAYCLCLRGDFFWDDLSLIVSNPAVKNSDTSAIFSPAYKDTGLSNCKNPLYFRPLQIFTYILDYRIWKLNPFGYHLTNLALHCLNTALLFFLLNIFFNNRFIAFFGAAFFGVNPIFTSSVTFISGRADLLLLLFVFLSMICFIKGRTISSLLCFIGALLSKEMAMMSLVLIFVVDRLVFDNKTTKSKLIVYLGFILIAFFYQLSKFNPLPGLILPSVDAKSLFFGGLTLVKGLAVYTALLFVPVQLHMYRTTTLIGDSFDLWLSVSFLCLLISLLISQARKNRLFVFGLIWLYGSLSSQLFFNILFGRRGNEMLLPEHNLYFAYPGFLILIFSLLNPLLQKAILRKALVRVSAFALAALIILTLSENLIWLDPIRYYKKIIGYHPNSNFNFVVYAAMGDAYERVGEPQEAERYFQKAAYQSCGNAIHYNRLAEFYLKMKDADKALGALVISRNLQPGLSRTYLLLGLAYGYKGDAQMMRACIEKSVALDPQDTAAKKSLELIKSKPASFPQNSCN